jgi:hypothetical protein
MVPWCPLPDSAFNGRLIGSVKDLKADGSSVVKYQCNYDPTVKITVKCFVQYASELVGYIVPNYKIE